MYPKFLFYYSLLTRLLASRSEQCSHSRTFPVLSSRQMPNVYKYIFIYNHSAVVFLPFCSSFSFSPSGSLIEAGGIAAFLRHLPSFNSPHLEPLHIFYVPLRIDIICYVLLGFSRSPGVDRVNPLRLCHAAHPDGQAIALQILLLGPRRFLDPRQ